MSQQTYFQNLEKQLPLCNTCAELQAVVNSTFASLSTLKQMINQQIAALLPFLSLSNPTDLSSVITWITNFSNAFLGPQIAAYHALVAQLAELTSAITDLTTAISNAEQQILGCKITIPPI